MLKHVLKHMLKDDGKIKMGDMIKNNDGGSNAKCSLKRLVAN